MKKKILIWIITIVVIIFAIYNIGFQIGSFSIGKQYDEVEVNNKFDIENSKFSKSYLNIGQTSVITLWASWCEPCIKEFPILQKLQNEFPEVKFAKISIDKSKNTIISSVKKFELDNDITLSNAQYRKAIRNFLDNRKSNSLIKSELIPVTYILKNGKVVYKEIGTLDYNDFHKKLKEIK